MKCKAERDPDFPLPICGALSLFLCRWLRSFISLSSSQRDAFLPQYHSLPPSTSDSPSLALADNDLPFFSESWTLHFSNVRLEKDLIRQGFFFFFLISWETLVVIKHMLFCMRATMLVYVQKHICPVVLFVRLSTGVHTFLALQLHEEKLQKVWKV